MMIKMIKLMIMINKDVYHEEEMAMITMVIMIMIMMILKMTMTVKMMMIMRITMVIMINKDFLRINLFSLSCFNLMVINKDFLTCSPSAVL